MGRSVRRPQPVEQFFQLSLLGLLASGYLAIAVSGSLDPFTTVFTGAGLLLRLLIVTGAVSLRIDPRLMAAATVVYVGFYPLDLLYVSQDFITSTIRLICFLAVARILTASRSRDYFFVKLIAFLELLAATLLAPGLSFFVFLILFVVFGVATFSCSEIRRSSALGNRQIAGSTTFHGRLAALSAGITVGIVLMTAGLFVLLPRTARAAFRSMVSERYHLPGFSGEVTLGQIGELKQRSTPVMHVRVDAPHDKLPLKWRGVALSQFDGNRWYNPRPKELRKIEVRHGPTQVSSDDQRRRPGERITYEVRTGPVDSDVLFLAGIPEFIQIDHAPFLFHEEGGSFRAPPGVAEGRHYFAVSHLPDSIPDPGPSPQMALQAFQEHLLLPGTTDARIIALAREIAGNGDTVERARAIEKHLKSRFAYTTDLLDEEVSDPLAHFLFERRKGHCEYFASGMAVMLRAIHVPARVVTGFQSGIYNPMTGWHIIRASDAHSWVEAWLPERGWTTFDPTPPDTSQPFAAAARAKLLLYLDAAETLWRQWVVGYNLERQLGLISRVERQTRLLSTSLLADRVRAAIQQTAGTIRPWIVPAAALVVVLVLAAIYGPRLWQAVISRRDSTRIVRGEILASDAAVLYGRMLALLRRRGLEKPSWLTPGEFARIVPAPAALLVEQFTSAYHELRYGGRTDAGPRMLQLLEELENSRWQA